jgi:hypothetical protein
LLTALGIVWLYQFDQRLPRHHLVHVSQELLALVAPLRYPYGFGKGALLVRGLLVVSEFKLLAAHQPCPGQ